MTIKKDKQKVLGEVFDDERIKTFLKFEAPEGVSTDFHLLEKAYRGMKIENFDTFLTFFLEEGHDINAENQEGKTLLAIAGEHRHGDDYADALRQHNATQVITYTEGFSPHIMGIKEDTTAPLHERILGTWRMLAWTRQLVGSNEESDAFGPDPTGYITYAPDGRLIVLALRSDRPRPSGSPPTEREKIALFDSMFAYAGTYTIESNRVIHTLDASWNELWTGTVQTRFISLNNGHLVYTTPETVDPMDGKLCTYKVTFERA